MSPYLPPSRRTLPLFGSLLVLLACGGEGAGSPSEPAPVGLIFLAAPSSGTWGDPFTEAPIVAAVDAEGTVVDTVVRQFTLTVIDGGAVQLAGIATVAATGGTATFEGLAVDRPAAGIRLVASAAGLAPDTTPPLTIGGPGPDHLVFVQDPAGATGGTAFATQPVVEVRTAGGRLVPWFAGDVALARRAGDPAGTLLGPTTRPAVNGTATFVGLAIDTAGAGYALVASAGGLVPDTSETFAVTIGPVAAAKSSFLPDFTQLFADDSVGFTLTARDAGGNVVAGAAALLSVELFVGGSRGSFGPFEEIAEGTYRTSFRGIAAGGPTTWQVLHDGRVGSISPQVSVVGVSQVSTGVAHTCAVLTTGALYCWGERADGRLGFSATEDADIPLRVGAESDWHSPRAGWKHSCAIRPSAVWCWGDDSWGQLARGGGGGNAPPAPVPGTAGATALEVSLGGTTGTGGLDVGYNTCIRSNSGVLRCAGDNRFGQLGDEAQGALAASDTLKPLSGGISVYEVAVGAEASCGRISGGALRCWGGNSAHQLGRGTMEGDQECPDGDGPCRPRAVPTALGEFASGSLDAGVRFTCGLRAGGVPYCWGEIPFGGGGSLLNPVPASMPVEGVKTVAVGAGNVCGLLTDGRVVCWGSNDAGQLGDGSVGDRTTLFGEIAGGRSYVAVDVGGAHACAIESGTHALYCWGDNTSGQLGDGTRTTRREPVKISFSR